MDFTSLTAGAGAAGSLGYVVHAWLTGRQSAAEKAARLERDAAIEDALDARLKPNDAMTLETRDRLTRLETDQFGANHGGLRETVDKLAVQVQSIALDVATIKGALSERN